MGSKHVIERVDINVYIMLFVEWIHRTGKSKINNGYFSWYLMVFSFGTCVLFPDFLGISSSQPSNKGKNQRGSLNTSQPGMEMDGTGRYKVYWAKIILIPPWLYNVVYWIMGYTPTEKLAILGILCIIYWVTIGKSCSGYNDVHWFSWFILKCIRVHIIKVYMGTPWYYTHYLMYHILGIMGVFLDASTWMSTWRFPFRLPGDPATPLGHHPLRGTPIVGHLHLHHLSFSVAHRVRYGGSGCW